MIACLLGFLVGTTATISIILLIDKATPANIANIACFFLGASLVWIAIAAAQGKWGVTNGE